MIAKIFKGENLHEGALQSLLVSSPIARSLPPHSLKMALQISENINSCPTFLVVRCRQLTDMANEVQKRVS